MIQKFRIPFMLLFVLIIYVSYQPAAHAQADCGSGVPQHLVIGGDGMLIPGQAANRLRSAPNGTQIGAIKEGQIFHVIGGPQCANDVSWWQVQMDDGTTGWTGEGVSGQVFLQPASTSSLGGGSSAGAHDSVPLVNTNKDCSGVTSTLKVGMLAQLNETTPQIEEFYGNPMVTGTLYPFPAQTNKDAILWGLFNFSAPVLIESGPVCFNGAYLWKIDGLQYSDTNEPSVWVFESANGQVQLTPSKEQPQVNPAFQPTRITLARNEAPPIINATQQLEFAGGGGCGDYGCSGNGPWSPDADTFSACTVGWFVTAVNYYQNACADLYPFKPGDNIEVTVRRPDGSIYSQNSRTAQAFTYTLQPDFTKMLNFEPGQKVQMGVIHVAITAAVGDPAGIWTIEARGPNQTVLQAYSVNENQFMDLQCDGTTPVVVFNGFEPLSKHTLVLAQLDSTNTNPDQQLGGNYREIDRWTLQVDQAGTLIAVPNFALMNGVLALDGPEGWQGNVDLRNGTNEDALTPKPCSSYFTPADAAAHPINYNAVVTGSFALGTDVSSIPQQYQLKSHTYYVFQGRKGDKVSIHITGFKVGILSTDQADLQPSFTLQDSSGTLIAQGDDQLADITLVSDGLYTITIGYKNTDNVDLAKGISPFSLDYMLELTSPSQGAITTLTTDLTLGSIVNGLLPDKTSWTFSGVKDEPISIDAQSIDFDAKLRLLDAEGHVLEEDDDGGDGMNARITLSLPQTGLYTIEVSGWNNKTGSYTLEIEP